MVSVAALIPCLKRHYCIDGARNDCEHQEALGYEYDGGSAEDVLAPANAVKAGSVNELPDGVCFDGGALVDPIACAIDGHEIVGIGQGDRVVTFGAGPMGHIYAMLAIYDGAAIVTKVVIRPGLHRREV